MHAAASRPFAVSLGVAALLAMAAAGVGAQDGSPAPSALPADALVVSTYAGYLPPDAPTLFLDETGIPVDVRIHADDAALVEALAAGDPDIDLAIVSGATAQAIATAGWLMPIDHGLVPGLDGLYPEATTLPTDPGNTSSVPYTWGTSGLCYRDDLVRITPDSWEDLLSPPRRLRGRTTMLASPRWLLVPPLRSLGFSVNTRDAAELTQATELLQAARPTLLGYDDATFHDRLVAGDAAMVQAWDAWCGYAQADPAVGRTVRFVLPREGADLWTDVLVIPAGARHAAAAHAFIDLVLRPSVQGWLVSDLLYKVPIRATMESVDPALLHAAPVLAITPARLREQEALQDVGDTAASYARIAALVTGP